MNKTELVETISIRTELSKKDVDAVLGAFFDIIGQVVSKGKEALTIPGWIKVEQVIRGPRDGAQPADGRADQGRQVQGGQDQRRCHAQGHRQG